MANTRIPLATLSPEYIDGRIFYAEDVNKIISIIVSGVNQNKLDMDKILTGNSVDKVVYSTYEMTNVTADEGAYMFFYKYDTEGDSLSLYQYVSNNWVFVSDISILSIYNNLDTLKKKVEENNIDTISMLINHTSNNNNPHNVTASQVGAYSKDEIDTLLGSSLGIFIWED